MIRCRRVCRGRERGQATVEYVGLLSAVALTVVAVVATLIAFGSGPVTQRVKSAACAVSGLVCDTDATHPGAADTGVGDQGVPNSGATNPGPTDSSTTGSGSTAPGSGPATADGASTVEVVDDSCHGWRECAWSGVKQVGSGGYNLGKGAVDDVTGLWDLVQDPSSVLDAGEYIAEHPLDAGRQLVWDDESEQMRQDGDYGGSAGRTIWNVGSWFIPGYDIAKGVSKIGKIGKVGKAAEEAEKAAKAAQAAKAAEAAEDASRAARKENGLDDAVKACANSFAGATLVLLADGSSRRIDQIAVGDTVLANDPSTGESSSRTVTAVLVHEDTDLTDLTIRGATGGISVIRTTPGHPFFAGSWTDAADLVPGDHLTSTAGRSAEVVDVRSFGGPATRYNLTVADVHTFFVQASDTPVLVHNDNGKGEPVVDSERLRKLVDPLYKGVGHPQQVGDGTTMASANSEARGGDQVEKKDHLKKAENTRNALQNFLNSEETRLKSGQRVPNVKTERDIQVAESLIAALNDALAGKYVGLDHYNGLKGC